MITSEQATPFFDFARKRHTIYLHRQEGLPRPWTDDKILDTYRFTNVYRELDRTTIWIREHIRDPIDESTSYLCHNLPAMVLARWFNRVETLRFLMEAESYGPLDFAGDLVSVNSLVEMERALREHHRPPWVTGAYIIKTPDGMDKLRGIMWCMEQFLTKKAIVPNDYVAVDWVDMAARCLGGRVSLKQAWGWLRQFPYMGDFMAYEVITDLRHTALLRNADDIMSWANPGPGAKRGLNRVLGLFKDAPRPVTAVVEGMGELLQLSRDLRFWPDQHGWPPLEMRDIEHTLCEFDKYERVRTGEGRPRGVYR